MIPETTFYHGGAPGFGPGDLIAPHPTKHTDGCEICAAAGDENHRPDRVFATPERIYAKYYASKWGRGSLYLVRPEGPLERSEADSIETYCAPAWRVLKVSERGVGLTMSERRRLQRIWRTADAAVGRAQGPEYAAAEAKLRRMLGFGPRERFI